MWASSSLITRLLSPSGGPASTFFVFPESAPACWRWLANYSNKGDWSEVQLYFNKNNNTRSLHFGLSLLCGDGGGRGEVYRRWYWCLCLGCRLRLYPAEVWLQVSIASWSTPLGLWRPAASDKCRLRKDIDSLCPALAGLWRQASFITRYMFYTMESGDYIWYIEAHQGQQVCPVSGQEVVLCLRWTWWESVWSLQWVSSCEDLSCSLFHSLFSVAVLVAVWNSLLVLLVVVPTVCWLGDWCTQSCPTLQSVRCQPLSEQECHTTQWPDQQHNITPTLQQPRHNPDSPVDKENLLPVPAVSGVEVLEWRSRL